MNENFIVGLMIGAFGIVVVHSIVRANNRGRAERDDREAMFPQLRKTRLRTNAVMFWTAVVITVFVLCNIGNT